MYYPDDLIERIRMENDIVNVISEYVSLKSKGNSYFGICPFHREHTPSFSVSADKQLYYCFGCGASGNVVSFIMQKENYDFLTAIKHLAERAKIPLPEEHMSEAARKDSETRKQLIELHKISARFYYECLISHEGEKARTYLDNRGIAPNTRIKYGLGYSPDSWDGLYRYLTDKGYKDGLLSKSGLFSKTSWGGYVDKFRNRLMFPIFNVGGNVIGFGGRSLDDNEPKYLNSPETMIFEKSRNLYSLNFARKENSKELFLVEGYMDVISLYQGGIKNAVASLGTAFNKNHGALLKKFAQSVILAFDGDQAGIKAASRAIPVLVQDGLRVKVLKLDAAKDPDEYIIKFGREAFEEAARIAMSHVAFNIALMEKEYDLETSAGKIDFTTAAAKLLSRIPSEIERDVYIKEASKITGISIDAIRTEVKKLSARAQPIDTKIKRNYNLAKEGKLMNKGLIEAKKSIILYTLEDERFLKAIKNVLNPVEMEDFVYSTLLKTIYNISESGGNVCPAELVNAFESIEEQKVVSDIFITTITPQDIGGKLQALSDHVRTVKIAYINNIMQSGNEGGMKQSQKLLDEKRNLEKLYISL